MFCSALHIPLTGSLFADPGILAIQKYLPLLLPLFGGLQKSPLTSSLESVLISRDSPKSLKGVFILLFVRLSDVSEILPVRPTGQRF